jgi:hypothetical protein
VDIISGILLLKSESLPFLLPAFVIVAVVEIPGDSSIAQAVQTLAENNIFSAPVTNPEASPTDSWAARYKGMVDYPSIILWVLELAEMAAAAFAAGSAAADVGMGAGGLWSIGCHCDWLDWPCYNYWPCNCCCQGSNCRLVFLYGLTIVSWVLRT